MNRTERISLAGFMVMGLLACGPEPVGNDGGTDSGNNPPADAGGDAGGDTDSGTAGTDAGTTNLTDIAAVRLNADGTLDTSFGTGGSVIVDLGDNGGSSGNAGDT